MTERLKFTYNNNSIRLDSNQQQNKTKQKIENQSAHRILGYNTYSTTCDIFNYFTSKRSHREQYTVLHGERKAYRKPSGKFESVTKLFY